MEIYLLQNTVFAYVFSFFHRTSSNQEISSETVPAAAEGEQHNEDANKNSSTESKETEETVMTSIIGVCHAILMRQVLQRTTNRPKQ